MAKPWEKYGSQAPADPKFPYEGPQAAATLGKTQAEIDAIRQRNANDAKKIQFQERELAAKQAVSQRNAQMQAEERAQKIARLDALRNNIQRTYQLYDSTIGETKGVAGLLDYLPTTDNRQFDAAGAALAETGLAAFRVPGVGAQSDNELKQFVLANRPTASDRDAVVLEKLRNLESRLAENYEAFGVDYEPQFRRRTKKKKSKRESGLLAPQQRVIDFGDY